MASAPALMLSLLLSLLLLLIQILVNCASPNGTSHVNQSTAATTFTSSPIITRSNSVISSTNDNYSSPSTIGLQEVARKSNDDQHQKQKRANQSSNSIQLINNRLVRGLEQENSEPLPNPSASSINIFGSFLGHQDTSSTTTTPQTATTTIVNNNNYSPVETISQPQRSFGTIPPDNSVQVQHHATSSILPSSESKPIFHDHQQPQQQQTNASSSSLSYPRHYLYNHHHQYLSPSSSINANTNGPNASSLSLFNSNALKKRSRHPTTAAAYSEYKVTVPGDIFLGGLFPIHQKGTKVECGEINRDRGIQRLEAMLYALDRINEDPSLLPGIKLGGILLDSCSSSTYALNQSLEFIRASINTVESSAFECKDKSAPRPKYGSKMIAGVIGGSYSEVTLQVANLLHLFRIPQVSYASTGTALSDKTLYDLFARTVPSDLFQARALADIVQKLGWSYVSLVSSEGLYGNSGSKEFVKQAASRKVCIATHEKISPTMEERAYDSLISTLQEKNTTGVVLFTRADDSRELLLAVKRARSRTTTPGLLTSFAWVAADGWGTQAKLIEGVEEVAWGAITVELQAKTIPGFDQYMRSLTPWLNLRNPWFSEYWETWFQCQLQPNLLHQQQVASGSSVGGFFSSFSSSSSAARLLATEEPAHNLWDSSPSDETIPSESELEFQQDTNNRPRRTSKNSQDQLNSNRLSATDPKPSVPSPISKPELEKISQKRAKRSFNMSPTSNAKARQFCSPNLRINESNGYQQEQKVQFVVDAVYAMAHALDKAWRELCGGQPGLVCEQLKELNDLAGSEVKFDASGDGLARYNIYNFRQLGGQPQLVDPNEPNAPPELDSTAAGSLELAQLAADANSGTNSGNEDHEHLTTISKGSSSPPEEDPFGGGPFEQSNNQDQTTSGSQFGYAKIGRWTENDYILRLNDVEFLRGQHSVPDSYCSKPCQLDQAKITRAGDTCCWICKTCAPYEYLPQENRCEDCGIGRWPNSDKKSCFDLPLKVLRWDSSYSLISLSVAFFGLIITAFVTIIFMKYIDTPVVKASGRELSFILLGGIACCHLSTPVLLSRPTVFVCGSQRFLVNFGFSVMYASLLVKTNRISRIFNCARKTAKRPSFISPKSQMIITAILVTIQIFLTIVWFALEPPGTRADSPEGKRDEVILKCKAEGKSFIISLIYNMILITTCTIYAVKTRKIPENFNESKFIGFTMYTTIVIWLAFVTMFFGTNNSYGIQIKTMCICVSLSAYVTLFCLFMPKVSIILLHPDKNVRKLTMNSATYRRPFKPSIPQASASAEGRINAPPTTSATYNGNPTDLGSGGPVSTTSQVLNLGGDRNTNQDSSFGSNVNNSSGAGSQSLGLITTNNNNLAPSGSSGMIRMQLGAARCANCGASQQQQTSIISSASALIANHITGTITNNSSNHSQYQAHSTRPNQLHNTIQAASPMGLGNNNSTSISHGLAGASACTMGPLGGAKLVAVATAASNRQQQQQLKSTEAATTTGSFHSTSSGSGGAQAKPGAKIIHSTRPDSASSSSQQTTARGACSSSSLHRDVAPNQRAPGPANRVLSGAEAASFDNNPNFGTQRSNNNNLVADETTPISLHCDHTTGTATQIGTSNSSQLPANRRHSQQNQHTSQTTADFFEGSQERESDSIHWSQSANSIDYCSDCCPSYCGPFGTACSCQSNELAHECFGLQSTDNIHLNMTNNINNNDNKGNNYSNNNVAAQQLTPTATNETNGKRASQIESELEDYDLVCEYNSAGQQQIRATRPLYPQLCSTAANQNIIASPKSQHHHQRQRTTCSSLELSSSTTTTQADNSTSTSNSTPGATWKNQSSSMDVGSCENQQQHHPYQLPSRLANPTHRNSLVSLVPKQPGANSQAPSTESSSTRKMTQSMEMKTIGIFTSLNSHNYNQDDQQLETNSSKSKSKTRSNYNNNGNNINRLKARKTCSEEEPSPVLFALQAAANSALSPCTIGTNKPDHQVPDPSISETTTDLCEDDDNGNRPNGERDHAPPGHPIHSHHRHSSSSSSSHQSNSTALNKRKASLRGAKPATNNNTNSNQCNQRPTGNILIHNNAMQPLSSSSSPNLSSASSSSSSSIKMQRRKNSKRRGQPQQQPAGSKAIPQNQAITCDTRPKADGQDEQRSSCGQLVPKPIRKCSEKSNLSKKQQSDNKNDNNNKRSIEASSYGVPLNAPSCDETNQRKSITIDFRKDLKQDAIATSSGSNTKTPAFDSISSRSNNMTEEQQHNMAGYQKIENSSTSSSSPSSSSSSATPSSSTSSAENKRVH